MPRDRYSPQLGDDLADLLRARFAAVDADLELTLSNQAGAVARFALASAKAAGITLEQLQQEVAQLARSWRADVEALLGADDDPAGIVGLFPRAYRDRIPPRLAAAHARSVNEMLAAGRTLALVMDIRPDGLHIAGFHPGGPLGLSRFVPLLESVGLTVIEELPDHLEGEHDLWAHDFLCAPAMGGVDPEAGTLTAAILACWDGRCETDSLNRLVTTAGMPWQDIAVLRAYRRYRRQLGTAFTPDYVNDALVTNPVATLALMAVFRDRFGPDPDPGAVDRAHAAIDDVESRDHDRILRDLLELVLATVRTNAWATHGSETLWDQRWPTLALKVDPASVTELPLPRPHREIFVNGPGLEGTHVRAGAKARGGIRWSDRFDDVRTEVLQLMEAQVLKNALIVPTGAKGGFVVKGGTGDATDVADRYRRFIAALLSVTDNLVEGQSVPPDGVRCHDEGDPYLVVAADRGTATFSDLANEIATDHGFWLGDAFASGGSSGYDHRGLGITARGAWEIARLHFAEIGIDPEVEEISAVGVGDMSGDVFGNGMVRSPTMRLLGAFDHRHVFIDPDPDPAVALAERLRLKDLPGSTWDDWDRSRLSDGGMIVPRAAKLVELTPQVQRLLAVADDAMSPPALIRALLSLNVDLLWFGGIGTWVRADAEPDEDVDDRANTEERVTAGDLHARVIVEGGNLAMTRRARWQYAGRGGRANLDAIDNAAGVTISDAEVNLKILLDDAVADGTIDRDERNALLRDWTDDVVASVLSQVRRQAWSLGAEVARGAAIRPALAMVRDTCESAIGHALPGLDSLDDRVGLSRPQVAVLSSVVRQHLADRMLGLPDFEPLFDAERAARLLPAGARKRFADHVERHPLRPQLAATGLVNDLVNLLGPTGPWALAMVASPNRRSDGAIDDDSLDRALLALACAFETLDVHDRLLRIDEERDLLGADRRREAERLLEKAVRATASVLLRGTPTAHDLPRDRRVLAAMWAAFEADRPGTAGQQGQRETVRRHLTDNLVHDELAVLLATASDLHVIPVLLRLARRMPDVDVPVALDVVLRASAGLGLDRIQTVLDRHEVADDRWARAQVHGLRSDIEDVRVEAATVVLTDAAAPEEALAVFMSARREDIAEASEILADVEAIRPPRLDAIAVAVRVLRDASRQQ